MPSVEWLDLHLVPEHHQLPPIYNKAFFCEAQTLPGFIFLQVFLLLCSCCPGTRSVPSQRPVVCECTQILKYSGRYKQLL